MQYDGVRYDLSRSSSWSNIAVEAEATASVAEAQYRGHQESLGTPLVTKHIPQRNNPLAPMPNEQQGHVASGGQNKAQARVDQNIPSHFEGDLPVWSNVPEREVIMHKFLNFEYITHILNQTMNCHLSYINLLNSCIRGSHQHLHGNNARPFQTAFRPVRPQPAAFGPAAFGPVRPQPVRPPTYSTSYYHNRRYMSGGYHRPNCHHYGIGNKQPHHRHYPH